MNAVAIFLRQSLLAIFFANFPGMVKAARGEESVGNVGGSHHRRARRPQPQQEANGANGAGGIQPSHYLAEQLEQARQLRHKLSIRDVRSVVNIGAKLDASSEDGNAARQLWFEGTIDPYKEEKQRIVSALAANDNIRNQAFATCQTRAHLDAELKKCIETESQLLSDWLLAQNTLEQADDWEHVSSD